MALIVKILTVFGISILHVCLAVFGKVKRSERKLKISKNPTKKDKIRKNYPKKY